MIGESELYAFMENFSFSVEYDQPHESQTNKDIMEAISRKGLGGLCGPDSPEGDGDYPLHDSPRNDSSNQNDNDYGLSQAILQNRNQINAAGGNQIFLKTVHTFAHKNIAVLC